MANHGAATSGDGNSTAKRGIARRPTLRRAAGVVTAIGCLLVLVSWWVPWLTVIRPSGAAVAVRAVDGSPGGGPFLLGCPGLGLILPLIVLMVAAFDWWRHESPRMPLPLIFIAALIGIVCVPLLIVVWSVSSVTLFCCFRGPSQAALVDAGGILALAGYVASLVGCMLALG